MTINPGVTLTVTSGAVFVGSGTTLTVTGGGTLAFGTADGVLQTVTGATLNVNTPTAVSNTNTTGSGGLTFAGTGTVALNTPSSISGVNQVETITFTGVTAGLTFVLQFGAQLTVPITYAATAGQLFANIQQALAPLLGNGALGNLALGGTTTAVTVTFQGAFANQSMPLILVATQPTTGTVSVSKNTGTGIAAFTTLDGGTLTLSGNNVLPVNSTLNLIGGTLQATTPVTLTNTVNLNNSNVTLGGGSTLVLGGPVTLSGLNDTVSVAANTNALVTGVLGDGLSPAHALTKTGSGTSPSPGPTPTPA